MSTPKYCYEIVCLANSRKFNHRCVAGKAKDGSWIRPVGNMYGGEISLIDQRFSDGGSPLLLDIIRVPMMKSAPIEFQMENHLIDKGFYWSKLGKISWDDAKKLADACPSGIWDLGCPESYHGFRDRVSISKLTANMGSLRLIHVNDFSVRASKEGADFGNNKIKVRGSFTHLGKLYGLVVTDPTIEEEYSAQLGQNHSIGEVLLCLSLGQEYNGFAYKLIAGVIRK